MEVELASRDLGRCPSQSFPENFTDTADLEVSCTYVPLSLSVIIVGPGEMSGLEQG